MIIPCPACNTRYKLPDIALGGKPRKVHCAKCGHMWKQQPGEGLPDPPPRARPGVKPPEQKPLKKKKKKVAPPPPPVEPLDEPLERFPGMGGFGASREMGPGGFGDEASALGDDAWMNMGNASVDFGGGFNDGGERPSLKQRLMALSRWIGFAAGIVALVVFLLSLRTQIVELWPASARLYDVIGLPVEPPGAGLQFQNVKSEQRVDNGVPVLVLEGQIANVSTTDRVVPAVVATSLGPDGKTVKSWRVTVTQARLEPGAIATFRSQERDPGVVSKISVTFFGD